MEKISYSEIIDKHPWIIKQKQNYIISPDSDGFLCGLLVSNLLNGKIVGFYDGKIALIKNGVKAKDCIFLDMDINRKNIKSIGHHMVTYNKRVSHKNFDYSNCIQPNVIRNFDGKNDFQKKYPFATIHLLIGIFQEAGLLKNISKDSIWPLLFTDGVWNNLFGYTENCLEWINFLNIDNEKHVLNQLFCAGQYSFYDIMLGLNDFLRVRDDYNAKGYYNGNEYIEGGRNKRTGDKLKISNPNGDPINLVDNQYLFDIHTTEKIRMEKFITSISKYVDWTYISENWCWDNFRLLKFTKGDFSKPPALSNVTFTSLMNKDPISMAMTSGNNIEYTLNGPDVLE